MQLGKLSREEIEKELISTGLSSEAVQGIVEVLSLKSLSKLEGFSPGFSIQHGFIFGYYTVMLCCVIFVLSFLLISTVLSYVLH